MPVTRACLNLLQDLIIRSEVNRSRWRRLRLIGRKVAATAVLVYLCSSNFDARNPFTYANTMPLIWCNHGSYRCRGRKSRALAAR